MLIVFFRVLLIYLLITACLRLMGKRQLGQLQPAELVVTILVSNIATMAIEDANVPLLSGVVPILALVCFDVLVSALALRSKRVRELVSGSPRIIIRDGQIDQHQLRELRFTIDDMMEQLRAKDVFDIRQVAFAIVETTGAFSVYLKPEAQPATAGMLQPSPTGSPAPPVVVISDGAVIESALNYCNLRPQWLQKVLQQEGYQPRQVFLMTCDRQAQYLIVPKQSRRGAG